MSAQPVTLHQRESHARPEVNRLLHEISLCSDPCRRRAVENEVAVRLLDLAESTARRYRNRGIPDDDLVQVARMGLVKAVRRYRPGVGHDFAAFATLTMSGEIKRHFRDTGWAVRPPRRLQELRAATVIETERLGQRLGRQPVDTEIAESLGISRHEVDATRRASAAFAFHSLDAPSDDAPSHQIPDPFDAFEVIENRDVLGRALRKLTPRQRRIVRMRFVEERTQREIGQAIGVSQMQVSRLLCSVLATLRAEFEVAAETVNGSEDSSAPELRAAGGTVTTAA